MNCLLLWLGPSLKTTELIPSDPEAAGDFKQTLRPKVPPGKEQSQNRQSYAAISGTKCK